MESNQDMSNFPSEGNSTFGDVTPSQIDAFDDVAREIKKIRLEDEESTAGAAAAVDVPSEKVSIKIQMKRKTPKCRRGPKIKHPLKCRECGKIFTGTSNRRKHEKNRVCNASKAQDKLSTCIETHYESIYAHLTEVYADIAKHMERALGRNIFEQNRNYLLDNSLHLMTRSWISERFNILASLATIEETESMELDADANVENL